MIWMVLLAIPLYGCQEPSRNEKPVYPVTGTVLVDGKPEASVQVTFHDVAGTDTKQPTFPTGMTDAEGKLTISTYAIGDGLPPGKYKLTFMWGKIDMLSMRYGGPDKLKKRYSDDKKSKFTIEVGEDATNDLGTIELKTK